MMVVSLDIIRNYSRNILPQNLTYFFYIFQAVEEVSLVEKSNEQHMLNPSGDRQWINPSKRLVDKAVDRWNTNNLRADNTSVVTVMLDPPGPPRAQVLKKQRELMASTTTGSSGSAATSVTSERGSMALVTNQEKSDCSEKTPESSIEFNQVYLILQTI